MAQSTRDIKRRIRGINNTKQITKAMELVSSAKMRKARLKLEKSRPYYNTVLNSISGILKNVRMNHPLLKAREVKKSLYIVVTADRGLAGGYNANISKLVESKVSTDKESNYIITVGLKGRDYFKNRGYKIAGEFLGITENPEFSHARQIGELAVDLYLKEEIDEINLVYTKFVSTLSYEPKILKLLPFRLIKDENNNDSKENYRVIEFEPSPEEVLDYLIPKYIEGTIFGALIESSSSEQAARRAAMESATENAEEMIDDLNISYNRVRQAAITMELTEISAGAEALK
ncbi:MAG: ATP synthase F1 subunit gamma [Tissierellaceae bacterium]|nr:ATP synthase F1 subunit gamma [Tissierellaceae bacterium]